MNIKEFEVFATDAIFQLIEKKFQFTPGQWWTRDDERRVCGGCILFGLVMIKSGKNADETKKILEDGTSPLWRVAAKILGIEDRHAIEMIGAFDSPSDTYNDESEAAQWNELGLRFRELALNN